MILETKAIGILKIKDIISHYEKITYNNNYLPSNLKVLIDCRDARVDINVNEIQIAHRILKNVLLKYNSIKEAVIVDKPYETALALLFKYDSLNFESYLFEVFCTKNAAKLWLINL